MRKMFSKNQIEEMIQSGIASGATKLYLHEITLDEHSYQIVSTKESSYVGVSAGEILAGAECLVMKYADSNFEEIIASNGDDEMYYILEGTITTIELSNTEVTADVVTPL